MSLGTRPSCHIRCLPIGIVPSQLPAIRIARLCKTSRPITIKAAKNLTFDTTEFRVRPDQPIRLTFENPDAVPHNWALLNPGKLETIGTQASKMIADPEAAARHYIPDSPDVLAYTDVVDPYSQFTIYFQSPKQPGRYPYLCTFPGHWMVMNGTMIVEEKGIVEEAGAVREVGKEQGGSRSK